MPFPKALAKVKRKQPSTEFELRLLIPFLTTTVTENVLYQVKPFLFCPPFTNKQFMEQCEYSSSCRDMFVYPFFLIPLVGILCI